MLEIYSITSKLLKPNHTAIQFELAGHLRDLRYNEQFVVEINHS